MKVTLNEDMWLVEDEDGAYLCVPWVRFREDGRSAPGFVAAHVRVLKEGTVVDVPADA